MLYLHNVVVRKHKCVWRIYLLTWIFVSNTPLYGGYFAGYFFERPPARHLFHSSFFHPGLPTSPSPSPPPSAPICIFLLLVARQSSMGICLWAKYESISYLFRFCKSGHAQCNKYSLWAQVVAKPSIHSRSSWLLVSFCMRHRYCDSLFIATSKVTRKLSDFILLLKVSLGDSTCARKDFGGGEARAKCTYPKEDEREERPKKNRRAPPI